MVIPGAAVASIPHSGRTVETVATVRDSRYSVRMPRRPKDPDELNSREAAALLRVSVTRFYQLVNQGHIKKHYVNKFAQRPYYSRKEILALLEEEGNERTADSDSASS